MSYKQAVLRDNPIGLWLLDGPSTLRTYATLLLEYSTYQDYLNNEQTYLQEVGSMYIQDSSAYNHNDGGSFGGNHGAFTLGSPNFQDVMTIITHANYDSQNNGCRITDNIAVDVFNMYNAFQSGYENKDFGIEFWALIPSAPTTDFPLVNLHAGGNQRMRIYINGDSIYFQVYFSNGTSTTTKKQIMSWDEPLHIFAIAKDHKIIIYVNGLSDEIISFDKSLTYYSDTYTRFGIGPAASGSHFTVNGLAFYDYELSLSQIRNHMIWAQKDSDPINYSRQTNVSHFSFDNNTGELILSKQYSTPTAYNEGTFSNVVTDGTGIMLSSTTPGIPATGTWILPVAATSYENFAGIELSWDSASYGSSTSTSKYVTVSVSYDNGNTYYNVTNGKNFPYFLSLYSSSIGVQILVKVTLFSPNNSNSNPPRLDNLNINLYKSINEISDSGLFQIAPASSATYMIKKDNTNILSRGKNLGIRFSAQDPGGTPGSAIISSPISSAYQSIEFWLEYDGSGSAILDTGAGSSDLYIDSSNVLHKNFSGGYLYVNGVDRTSAPITLVNGEVYHVVVVYASTKTHNILLNGSYDGSKTPSEASYGYITVYPSNITLSQAQTRFLSFISVYSSIARDSVTSLGSILEYSGSVSNINNGQAISFHRHIY